jgi:cytochrome c biogenesis protein
MRTALVLLFLLALASVAGSLIPQFPNTPDRVAEYLRDHALLGEIYLRLGFFDVFGTWWFALITALLVTSLVACLLPRSRAHLRAIRQRPLHARELDAFPMVHRVRVGAAPADAGRVAAQVLRRRRYRVAHDGASVAAEKGILREAGSLVFHWAFLLLLLGAIVGKGTGYAGRAAIVEGETWTDARLNYDATSLREGRYFRGDFSGLGLRLVDYRDAFDPTNAMPVSFASDLELLDAQGATVGTATASVNHPVRFGPLRIFQFGFGWAPVLTASVDGAVVSQGPVLATQATAPEGRAQLSMPWHGFVKLPGVDADTDMAVEFELWPDGQGFLFEGKPMFDANAPLIRYRVWEGRLLDPSKAGLDTRFMEVTRSGFLWGAATADLERACLLSGPASVVAGDARCPPGDARITLRFDALPHYSVLQVSKDVGVPLVLAAAILIVVGLLAALYTSRRKLWVRAEPDGDGSSLTIAGFALQRRSQFEAEFARTVEAVVRAAGGPVVREPVGTS